jgi:oxygen-independent coproporphyrinogen-3 oxidase
MMAIGHLYDLTADCEIALELDPRLMSADLLRALRDGGVNRVSLGVQDFDPEVQAAINRIQPYDLVRRAVDDLRGIGVQGLNLDLIYGLPHQTGTSFAHTIDLALSLDPDRLAIFGYAHVPWMKAHQRLIDEKALPDAAQRFAMAESAAAQVIAAGYRRIGLDHFAKAEDQLALALEDRSLRRNFQGYTADSAETLIGFGPSAISALPQGFVQNLTDTGAWSQKVAKGELAAARGVALTAEDRLRSAIIERLMCFGEVDFGGVALELGAPAYTFHAERARLAPLIADGLAELTGSKLRITERGRPFQRLVAAAFDAYFSRSAARHSRAV